jgi:hypothetical protein
MVLCNFAAYLMFKAANRKTKVLIRFDMDLPEKGSLRGWSKHSTKMQVS